MNDTSSRTGRDEVFGARLHDPALWRDHPLVAEAEVHFDGEDGWVGLSTRATTAPAPSVRAVFTDFEATRHAPLYFWGEIECPIALFEHIPNATEVRIFTDPDDVDARNWWSVGVWLATPS